MCLRGRSSGRRSPDNIGKKGQKKKKRRSRGGEFIVFLEIARTGTVEGGGGKCREEKEEVMDSSRKEGKKKEERGLRGGGESRRVLKHRRELGAREGVSSCGERKGGGCPQNRGKREDRGETLSAEKLSTKGKPNSTNIRLKGEGAKTSVGGKRIRSTERGEFAEDCSNFYFDKEKKGGRKVKDGGRNRVPYQ